jgi:hypothetical protein
MTSTIAPDPRRRPRPVSLSTLTTPSVTSRPSTARGLLFGLNYENDPDNRLAGCINDVRNVAAFLTARRPGIQLKVFDDVSSPEACTKAGILKELNALVDAVNADPSCEYVWIHYSGHGASTLDRSGDESDRADEALVPLDFRTAGLVLDDDITKVLARFARKSTKVVCVMDSCHSGTVCDLKYRWTSATRAVLDNVKSGAVTAKVILLSGCLDSQTSADAFGVLATGKKEAGGALTGCLLNTLADVQRGAVPNDAFVIQQAVLAQLRTGRFTQRPLLTSSFNLKKDLSLL